MNTVPVWLFAVAALGLPYAGVWLIGKKGWPEKAVYVAIFAVVMALVILEFTWPR